MWVYQLMDCNNWMNVFNWKTIWMYVIMFYVIAILFVVYNSPDEDEFERISEEYVCEVRRDYILVYSS
jgi:hypothetical protein